MEAVDADANPATAPISAWSERQAMDWSLVLVSQGIEVEIAQPNPTLWQLLVAPADHARALNAIQRFRLENRHWAWRHLLPSGGIELHPAVLVWVCGLAGIHAGLPADLVQQGLFNTHWVRAGQWWRAFTAVGLHADLGHLAANSAVGLLVIGLAMTRFGAVRAFTLTWLAAALANFSALAWRDHEYTGLGASGMVMAAIGLITAEAVTQWRFSRFATRSILGVVGAGTCLFLLLGTSGRGDILVHTAGFLWGLVLGGAAAWIGSRRVLVSRSQRAGF